MRRLSLAVGMVLLFGCRFKNEDRQPHQERIVSLSNQYSEILYALGANRDLVAVDLSSTYPPEIKSLPTVGYHRALSAEGIVAVKPTLILHDNNVGPEHVMRQLEQRGVRASIPDDEREIGPEVSRSFAFTFVERHFRQPSIALGDFEQVQLVQISERLDGLVCRGGLEPNSSNSARSNRMVEPSCARFMLAEVRQSTRTDEQRRAPGVLAGREYFNR
ncbi:MAG TPA: ABC transporter substrate-binding protein [Myxococcaceae bacterium]|nr:ABC transporter substrate-binding protein [Myxococcaceae bacterium]